MNEKSSEICSCEEMSKEIEKGRVYYNIDKWETHFARISVNGIDWSFFPITVIYCNFCGKRMGGNERGFFAWIQKSRGM